jgi:hypothetical protein
MKKNGNKDKCTGIHGEMGQRKAKRKKKKNKRVRGRQRKDIHNKKKHKSMLQLP